MIDIESVRPHRLTISDKYSVNLYRYIRKWREWGIGALASDRNWITGDMEPFDFKDPKPGRIVIGRKDDDGWMSGSHLNAILTSKNAERWAFMPKDAAHYRDVSDWFWPEYARMGRAIWDASGMTSMSGDEDRWETVGENTRRCRWSGRIYRSHIETTYRRPVVRTVWTRVDDNQRIAA